MSGCVDWKCETFTVLIFLNICNVEIRPYLDTSYCKLCRSFDFWNRCCLNHMFHYLFMRKMDYMFYHSDCCPEVVQSRVTIESVILFLQCTHLFNRIHSSNQWLKTFHILILITFCALTNIFFFSPLQLHLKIYSLYILFVIHFECIYMWNYLYFAC